MTRHGLLIDNSAWVRLSLSGLAEARSSEIADAFDQGTVYACLPFLLEAGYSARSSEDYSRLMNTLSALPRILIDEAVETRATDAQTELAGVGHQRVTPVDVLLAALADRHDLDVLHYDRHYDAISEHTGLQFDSVWLAPRGSLDAPYP